MNTSEINHILSEINFFIGTFPCDYLPKLIPFRPCSMIVNTDSASESGEHWTAIILLDENRAEYFDSFGFPPLVPKVQQYLNEKAVNGIEYSSKTMQHPESIACGLYCIEFIKWRSLNFSYHCFISNFSENLAANDSILQNIKERRDNHAYTHRALKKGKNVGARSCSRQ